MLLESAPILVVIDHETLSSLRIRHDDVLFQISKCVKGTTGRIEDSMAIIKI